MDPAAQRAGRLPRGSVADRGARPRAGLGILVPGYPQWSWRQRERALVLFGSFAVALLVGSFSWGTRTGLAILLFAFSAHVFSIVDVIRQSAFPGFGRWAPWISASGGLAVAVYGPALLVGSLLAWPAMDGAPGLEGYLVNCCAYQKQPPDRGDWVWLRSSPRRLQVGRVVAGAGEEVEWSQHQLRVQGTRVSGLPFRSAAPPKELTFIVPEGHLLVDTDSGSQRRLAAEGLVLVPREQVAGRAWARMYPLWERQLLH